MSRPVVIAVTSRDFDADSYPDLDAFGDAVASGRWFPTSMFTGFGQRRLR